MRIACPHAPAPCRCVCRSPILAHSRTRTLKSHPLAARSRPPARRPPGEPMRTTPGAERERRRAGGSPRQRGESGGRRHDEGSRVGHGRKVGRSGWVRGCVGAWVAGWLVGRFARGPQRRPPCACSSPPWPRGAGPRPGRRAKRWGGGIRRPLPRCPPTLPRRSRRRRRRSAESAVAAVRLRTRTWRGGKVEGEEMEVSPQVRCRSVQSLCPPRR